MAHLHLNNVHIRYPVFSHGVQQSALGAVASVATFGRINRDARKVNYVHALRGVSLRLNDGDRIGIIGRNGSGKTTLLKTASGIFWPQEGTRHISGSMACILSAGAGLDLQKTGAENVRFLGGIFGLNKSERADLLLDVADFTELGEFFDLPVCTYSAGMMVRLGFALVTALRGDILVIDEVLSAGDTFFLKKASERIEARATTANILIMATHSPAALEAFCDHAVWLHQGVIVDHGAPNELWGRYSQQTPRFEHGVDVTVDPQVALEAAQ